MPSVIAVNVRFAYSNPVVNIAVRANTFGATHLAIIVATAIRATNPIAVSATTVRVV